MQANSKSNEVAILHDYDAWHHQMKSDAEHESPLVYPWYESVYREIKDYPSCRVLEVGCGRGGFAIWLSRQAPQFSLTGLDFSGAAIEIAKESASAQNARVDFVQGDAEALPFADGTFDLVISCECMEHVPHPPQMARELARVIKTGGRFCLTTENYFNGMLIAWLKSWWSGQPYNSGSGIQPRENFFFFWMVRSYLQDAGLTVAKMESSHHQWLLLPRVNPARLCTEKFSSKWARTLAFPFGRHVSFFGHK